MSPRLAQSGKVNLLASRLQLFGINHVGPQQLHRLLQRMDYDVDLAVDAFMMSPWPTWFADFGIYKLPE